jgi:hypothetical protein
VRNRVVLQELFRGLGVRLWKHRTELIAFLALLMPLVSETKVESEISRH